jgi:serine/threonine-protein kinase
VHEAGEADGEVFIAMEYVEGSRLSDIIYPSGISSEKVVGYGLQLVAALAHAHERGIIHRDLKPANIIITPQDRLKLLDFGLAQRISSQGTSIREQGETTTVSAAPQSVDRACTLAYAAPEVLGGTAANASSDIWCLGIVFYEMATGTLPFVGHTVFELTSAILNQPCPVLPASTPAGLNLIVQRCLEKQPLRRYQRAAEVRAALEAVSHASASENRKLLSMAAARSSIVGCS